MKICLLSLEWPPYGCGIATYMYNLARGLVESGQSVTLITHDRSPISLQGLKVVPVPVRDFPSSIWMRMQKWRMEPFHTWSKLAYRTFLMQSHIQGGFDVIETAEYGAWGRGLIAGRTPLVVRCHNPTRLLFSHLEPGLPLWLRIQDSRERRMATHSDALISPSNALSHWLQEVWQIPIHRTSVIPNPIDEAFFCPQPSLPKVNEIVFVGRLEERKGVFDLAEAVVPLLERFPDLQVRYIGKDMRAPGRTLSGADISASEYIKANLCSSSRERVSFLGQIPLNDILPYWRRALCAIVPSRMMESFSYTTLEAMACGCPVVVSRQGGPMEIITHGEDGLLFPPRNSVALRFEVLKLLTDESLRDRLALNARKTVERRFGISVVTREVLQQYQQAMGKRCAVNRRHRRIR